MERWAIGAGIAWSLEAAMCRMTSVIDVDRLVIGQRIAIKRTNQGTKTMISATGADKWDIGREIVISRITETLMKIIKYLCVYYYSHIDI